MNLFSTRSTLPTPFLPARIFNFCKRFPGDNFLLLIVIGSLVFLLFGCQTIENKADKIGKKEIKEVSKFLQQPESELKIEMGEPDEVMHDEKGSKFYVYKKKKYGITCEKKFEIDENNMIVGASTRGCF